MKRIVLFLNGSKEDGRVVAVTHSATLNDLLLSASSKLGVNAAKLFTRHGGLVDDVHLVRDDDVLYVSEGESFISFEEKTTLERQAQRGLLSSSRHTNALKGNASTSNAVGMNDAVGRGGSDNQSERHHPTNAGMETDDALPNAAAACQSSTSPAETLPGDWITINVGGKLFTTTRSTLTNKEPNSMLARMFTAGKLKASIRLHVC